MTIRMSHKTKEFTEQDLLGELSDQGKHHSTRYGSGHILMGRYAFPVEGVIGLLKEGRLPKATHEYLVERFRTGTGYGNNRQTREAAAEALAAVLPPVTKKAAEKLKPAAVQENGASGNGTEGIPANAPEDAQQQEACESSASPKAAEIRVRTPRPELSLTKPAADSSFGIAGADADAVLQQPKEATLGRAALFEKLCEPLCLDGRLPSGRGIKNDLREAFLAGRSGDLRTLLLGFVGDPAIDFLFCLGGVYMDAKRAAASGNLEELSAAFARIAPRITEIADGIIARAKKLPAYESLGGREVYERKLAAAGNNFAERYRIAMELMTRVRRRGLRLAQPGDGNAQCAPAEILINQRRSK